MRTTSNCEAFIHNIIHTYTTGDSMPYYEAALEPGAQTTIEDIRMLTNDERVDQNGEFSLNTMHGHMRLDIEATLSCQGHRQALTYNAFNITSRVTSVDKDTITINYNSPKLNDYWQNATLGQLQEHQRAFSIIAPLTPLMTYVGAVINKAFFPAFSDNNSATSYLHIATKNNKHLYVNKVNQWRRFETETDDIGLYLSLNAPNAGWFNLATEFNIAKPKEFIREMYMKVLKRRTEYTLNEIYARAKAEGLLE